MGLNATVPAQLFEQAFWFVTSSQWVKNDVRALFGEDFADRRPTPAPARAVTTATRPRRPAAIYLAQDPGVFHDTPAGDVDQAAAGRGDAGHGAGHDLDGFRVRYED